MTHFENSLSETKSAINKGQPMTMTPNKLSHKRISKPNLILMGLFTFVMSHGFAMASALEKLKESSTESAGLINGPVGFAALGVGSIIGIFSALRSGSLIATGAVIAIIIAAIFGFDTLSERFMGGN